MKPQQQCTHCREKFTTEEQLSRHIALAHNDSLTIYTCEICQRQFQYKGSYSDHLKSHAKEDIRYECTECPCFFKNHGHLKSHIRDVHSAKAKEFHCNACPKVFYSKTSMSQHLHNAHLSVQVIHKCKFCERIYGSRSSLKWHIHINHNKDYVRSKCPYCPSDFKWPHHLKVHIRKAHIEKGHTPTDLLKKGLSSIRRKTNDCVVCNEKFDKKLDLMLHLKGVHKQELDIYKCCRCTAVFSLKNSLKFHLDEHRKKDPKSGNHCCEQCHPESNPILYKEEKTEVVENDGRTEIEKEVIDFELTLMQDEDVRRLIRYRLKHAKKKHSTDQDVVFKELDELDVFSNGIKCNDVCSENGEDLLDSTNNLGKVNDTIDTINIATVNNTVDKVAKICLERFIPHGRAQRKMADMKQCNICKNKFESQRSLNEHIKLCHSNAVSDDASNVSKEVCNGQEHLNVAPKLIEKEVNRFKIYNCKLCKEKFRKPINLGRHVRLVHGKRRKTTPSAVTNAHKCKHIDMKKKGYKSPASSNSQTEHAAAETGRSGKPVKAKSGIAELKRVNTKMDTQKLYQCGKCVLYFKSKLELLRHISDVHMGIRPKTSDSYFCDYCNSKFSTKVQISEHMKCH